MSDSPIADYYHHFDEASRLDNAVGQLEFLRTMELLARSLPPVPARILDIGGGPGRYAEALGRLGYEVHLLDLMPNHVEAARSCDAIASAQVGDARNLPWSDEYADAVLLLGPLYHLTDRGDRLTALGEARRVLRPSGILAAAGISRFAPLLDGILTGAIDDPRFQSILLADLNSGQHRNPSATIDYFTTAFFHLPEELRSEVAETGFRDARVYPVEGMAGMAPDLNARWADAEKRQFLLELLRQTEQQQELTAATFHLLAIGRASA